MTITPPSNEVPNLRLQGDPDVAMTAVSAELDHATADLVRPGLLRWFARHMPTEGDRLWTKRLDLLGFESRWRR